MAPGTNVCSIVEVVRVEYRIEPCRSRPESRLGDAVRLVAQPVHGLRAPLHLLLRPGVRAARRPALRRGLRHLDQGEGERRRRAPRRASQADLAGRKHRDRCGHRSLSARRGPLPAHQGLHRGARRGGEPVRDHHPRADDRARPRRARRGGSPRRGVGDLLGADARPRGLAAHRARHRPAPSAPACARAARRCRDPGVRRHGADPPGDLRPARAARRGGARSP